MAPATSLRSPTASQRHVGFIRRTQAPQLPPPSPEPAIKKYKMMTEIMAKARIYVVCGINILEPLGNAPPLVECFFPNFVVKDQNELPLDARKRRKRSGPRIVQKKKRRLLPFVPSEDPAQRLKQMGSLASALTALNIEFSDHLTYLPGMAPRSANEAGLESGGMQILTKEDTETMEHCKAMSKRGECPPFMVVFDSCEGYTVEADGPIKDMTFIAEYTGDVDYLKKRERDDCDSIMTLILASEPVHSLVICADKRGNIARFISGINNHTPDGKKKQNCKCLRYNVNGESRVFLVATRDIAKGERLYYDYNGYEDEYPTHHFV
ncbi:hypothetical protein TanjilG_26728 [Lupinus angustifolius]|uniref:[histone H3]-lysine(27) N-methyltransferase n=1 Tax=Lupinus angustifolius TaxID=3871 RepID=A0A1J7IRI0_LUPAN|nr:hypothetical protein TanjilG_26728 [Lupinus angustifolius]